MASIEELTREIGRARADLATTLEAVGDRVAPKKVVARAKADVAERVEEVRERMSPVRVLQRRTESVRSGIRNVQESLMGGNDDVAGGNQLEQGRPPRRTGTGRGPSQRVADQAGDLSGAVGERARRAPANLRDKAVERPFVAGLVAFGGGVLLASLLAPSDSERKVAQRLEEKAQPVKDQALQAGRSVADEVGQAAQESTEQVRRRASDAATEVKRQAKASTQQAKDEAKSAGAQVKRQAKAASSRVKTEAKRPSTTTTTTTEVRDRQSPPAKKVTTRRS